VKDREEEKRNTAEKREEEIVTQRGIEEMDTQKARDGAREEEREEPEERERESDGKRKRERVCERE